MPFDGVVTRAITKDLQDRLIGGRIDKIYEPSDTELVMTIRNRQKNYRLLFSIHPSYARIHITTTSFKNPDQPPLFCMTLRKFLIGARVEAIEQLGLERIVQIDFRGRDEIGDEVSHQLMVEIMGRHSNLIFIEKESKKIVHAKKLIPPAINRHRSILPGSSYLLPPQQDKLNLLDVDADSLLKRLDFNQGRLDRQIVEHVTGFSPFLAKELVERCQLGSQERYRQEINRMKEAIIAQQYQPAIYENGREDYHVLAITYLNEKERFSDLNELLDYFYSDKAERDRVKQSVKDLSRLLQNEIKKNKRKLTIHQDTLKQSKKAERFQKYGELLTANMHRIKKGMKSIEVTDYYDEKQGTITIALKEELTPSENAQSMFRKYRKLLRAKDRAKSEIDKAKAEIDYLESILQQLDQAREKDIEDIREELQEEGYLRKRRKKLRKKKKPEPDRFTSSDGTLIYVGRNNLQNEYVTHRLAHKEDIWLHTLDIPGSHVIIKSSEPSEATLIEAAQLAAYYSKARWSESVPVDYTKVKYVKKPKGAKPGFVIYTEQKTLFVRPKSLN